MFIITDAHPMRALNSCMHAPFQFQLKECSIILDTVSAMSVYMLVYTASKPSFGLCPLKQDRVIFFMLENVKFEFRYIHLIRTKFLKKISSCLPVELL